MECNGQTVKTIDFLQNAKNHHLAMLRLGTTPVDHGLLLPAEFLSSRIYQSNVQAITLVICG